MIVYMSAFTEHLLELIKTNEDEIKVVETAGGDVRQLQERLTLLKKQLESANQLHEGKQLLKS
jgi:hypothetical protein